MKELEKEILLKAFGNHELERKEPAFWRVGIKSYISQGPVELSSEKKLIDGIYEPNWMKFTDLSPTKNLVMDAKNRLMEFLNSHHMEGIEPSRTANIQSEIFLKLGYVFVLSNRLYEKSRAESLMADWQKRGLNAFILSEIPPGSDLYASEALEFIKYADLVQTVHLVPRGHIGRIPGSVEGVLVGEKETVIKEAAKLVDSAFQALEKSGLAVRVQGFNFCFTWSGLSLTRAGVAMAEKIQEDAYQNFLAEQASRAPEACKVKCLSCGEVLLQTTSLFRPDKAVTGAMLRLLPNLSESTWQLNFGYSDAGEAITCPNCGIGLIDQDSGRFQESVLIFEGELEQEELGADVLNLFLSTMCVEDPDKETLASELYDAYQILAKEKNKEPISKKAFGLALAEKGFDPFRGSNGIRMWRGIKVKSDV